jgi:DNA-binding MarR family transcriptional regulator
VPVPPHLNIAMLSAETEIDLLEKILESSSDIRQRDLARIIGLSLGMANAILKRLVQKGLLKIQKVNNRNIQYVVSPKGMERIARRSYRYFRQTVKNVVYYKEAIEELLRRIESQGFTEVVLVGASDLDFIVEPLCAKHHLALRRTNKAGPERNGQRFLLYSEKYLNTPPAGPHSALLRRLILLSRPRSRPSVA